MTNFDSLFIYLQHRFYQCDDPLEPIQILFDEAQPSFLRSCLQASYEELSTTEKNELINTYASWAKENCDLLGSQPLNA